MGNVTEALADIDEKVRSWEERISKLGHSAGLPVASFLLGGVMLGRGFTGWGRLNSILIVTIGNFKTCKYLESLLINAGL